MAFDLQRFVRQTEALNSGALVLDDATIINGPALYTYESSSDSLAVIAGAGYFNSEWTNLFVGDFIMATGANVTSFYRVTAVDEALKTVTIATFNPSGPVTTAGIQDGAVTAAKLATAVTPVYVSKFGGVANYAGGGTSTTITQAGILATDVVIASLKASANFVNIKAVPAAGSIAVTFSADPGAGTIVSYQVFRAVV